MIVWAFFASTSLIAIGGTLTVLRSTEDLITIVSTLPFGVVSIPGSTVELAPLAAVLVLGIIGTGLAYLLMGALVSRVGPTRASYITYLIPGVSLVLGVVFKDDHVAALAVAGVALVIVGAMLAGRQERPVPVI